MKRTIFLSVFGLAFLLTSCAQAQVAAPNIITKKEWGGTPPSGTKEIQQIEYITIHHGGVDVPEDKDPIEYLKNLERFSKEDKHWIDNPYHYMIDLDGNIYEARPLEYAGDTNTEYDPEGHALICVIGNYENQKIKPSQLESLAQLTAWLAEEYEVPVTKIATHKDYSDETVCPGEDLYAYFENGTFITMVKELLK